MPPPLTRRTLFKLEKHDVVFPGGEFMHALLLIADHGGMEG